MESKSISVLLASDIPMLRGSVTKLLNDTNNVQVVACAETQNDVLPFADVHRPGLAILDLDVDQEKLRHLITGLSAQRIPALLMNDAVDEMEMFELFLLGLAGVIPRRASGELLCKSVCAVAAGELWISRQVVPKLVQHARLLSQNNPLPGAVAINQAIEAEVLRQPQAQAPSFELLQNRFNLTRRELQIVKALHDAMTNKEIATQFGISEYTVKHHLTKIFDKVGVYNRLELVMFASHHGLVSPASPTVTGLLAS